MNVESTAHPSHNFKMISKSPAVQAYLDKLPPDRRDALDAVRQVFLKNLDKNYEEGIQYGMIGYYLPHTVHPAGYHCNPKIPLPFAILGSKKDYMSLHFMCVYHANQVDTVAYKTHEAFTKAWAKTGKKLNMGKACINFKSADELALDVIGQTIKQIPAKEWIKRQPAPKKPFAKKSTSKKPQRTRAKK